MCSVAAAALALQAYGTIQQAQNQKAQGEAVQAQNDYQAAILRNNKILADRKADDARERGENEAFQNDLQTRQIIGRQVTQIANTGQEVNTGSGLEITSDTASLGRLDSLRIVNNAEREALGFESQGMNFESEARLKDATGRNARSAGNAQAFGTLVTGAGKVAGKWYEYDKAGAFN